MPLRRVWLLAVAALFLLVPGATSSAEDAAPGDSLAGQLLIASPGMGDPRFRRTVILMVRHNAGGALGIVINRPVTERPLADLLEALGVPDAGAKGDVRIYAGGPVETSIGFVIHSTDYRRPGTVSIDGRVAMTGGSEVLRDMSRGRGPDKSLLAFGYAGWGPGQLEREMADGGWFTAPAEPGLVFDAPREAVWREAYSRRARDL